jgi:hypothetical protein
MCLTVISQQVDQIRLGDFVKVLLAPIGFYVILEQTTIAFPTALVSLNER